MSTRSDKQQTTKSVQAKLLFHPWCNRAQIKISHGLLYDFRQMMVGPPLNLLLFREDSDEDLLKVKKSVLTMIILRVVQNFIYVLAGRVFTSSAWENPIRPL